jgi:hypothetical protein
MANFAAISLHGFVPAAIARAAKWLVFSEATAT